MARRTEFFTCSQTRLARLDGRIGHVAAIPWNNASTPLAPVAPNPPTLAPAAPAPASNGSSAILNSLTPPIPYAQVTPLMSGPDYWGSFASVPFTNTLSSLKPWLGHDATVGNATQPALYFPCSTSAQSSSCLSWLCVYPPFNSSHTVDLMPEIVFDSIFYQGYYLYDTPRARQTCTS